MIATLSIIMRIDFDIMRINFQAHVRSPVAVLTKFAAFDSRCIRHARCGLLFNRHQFMFGLSAALGFAEMS